MTFPTLPPQPTSPPPAPSRADPDPTFSSKADAFVAWFTPFTTWLQNFITYIGQFITELSSVQTDVTTKATNAANSASNAAASEINAASSANAAANIVTNLGVFATSSTSLTVAYGTKTITTQSGKGFANGMYVALNSTEGYQMIGRVTSYSGTTLVVESEFIYGAGNTSSNWSIGFYDIDAERAAFMWSQFFSQ